MKLEVGMYVRTKWGDIRKIERIWNDTDFNVDKTYYNYNILEDTLGCVLNEDIIKEPSFNIIDLIEAEDYVNGSKVIKIENVENYPDLSSVKIEKSDFRYGVYETVFEKDIKAIVTHEQMEQMSYKAGDK